MGSSINLIMISAYSRQALSLLLAILLSGAPSFAQAQSSPPQSQSSPPQTVPNEAQLDMAPHPNPKIAKKISELGDKALADGHFDEALNYYQQAVRYAPQDASLLERIASLRSKLIRAHVEAAERDALAGHADVGTEELAKALLIDPNDTIVAERLIQMKAMKDEPLTPNEKIEGLPELKPRAVKLDLDLRGDTKSVYEQVGQLFGIKVTFDPDLSARTVRLHALDVDFATALKILGIQTGTFFRALTSNLLFVAQDTAEKRRQYAVQAKQTFVLPDSVSTEDMTELSRVLKEMTGSTRVELDAQARAITIRDTPERLALAGELIHQAEKARGEVLLDIEILEVDRNKARTLGILPPASLELISLSTGIISQLEAAKDIGTLVTLLASIFGNGGTAASAGSSLTSLIPPVARVGGGNTTFLLTMPTFAAQFSDALTLVHSGTQVLLRAQDGKPASFFVGDRYPVTLSLLSGSLGASTPATSVGATTGSILPSVSYNVGIGPVAITSSDFRNLGVQDIAVVNEIDNTVTILQNQGLGVFLVVSPPISLGAARTTAPVIAPSIASAVLTTSGFHDLVVTDPVANTVQVLLSNGDDTFKEATGSPITVGQQPSSIVLGDFNADGIQDFVVTNFKDNTFSLFLGNNDGTFKQATGSPFALPTTATGPIAMTSADFNSDGNLDLAIANQTTNDVAILLGNGSGSFSLATGSPFTVGQSPVAIASTDLNLDSHPDLAIVNQVDNITLGPTYLMHDSWGVGLGFTGLTVRDAAGRTVLSAPRGKVGLNPFALALLEVKVRRLELDGLDLRLRVAADGALSLAVANDSGATPIPLPGAAPAGEGVAGLAPLIRAAAEVMAGATQAMDRLTLANGHFKIDNDATHRSVVYNDFAVVFDHSGSSAHAAISATGPAGPWTITAQASDGDAPALSIDARDLSLADIQAFDTKPPPLTAEGPIAIKFDAELTPQSTLRTLTGRFSIGAGRVRINNPDAVPFFIDEATGDVAWDEDARRYRVDRLEVLAGETHVEAQGLVRAAGGRDEGLDRASRIARRAIRPRAGRRQRGRSQVHRLRRALLRTDVAVCHRRPHGARADRRCGRQGRNRAGRRRLLAQARH